MKSEGIFKKGEERMVNATKKERSKKEEKQRIEEKKHE